jgi:hypothetical protein
MTAPETGATGVYRLFRLRPKKPELRCDLTYPHLPHIENQYDSRYRMTLCPGIEPPSTRADS